MKKGKVRIIIGSILIFLQLLSVIGNAKIGININLSFDNFSVFLYDLIFLLSYFLIGIIGVILLISGLYSYNKKPKSIQHKENIPIANQQEPLIEEKSPSNHDEKQRKRRFYRLCGEEARLTVPSVKECFSTMSCRKSKIAIIVLSIVCGLLVGVLAITTLHMYNQSTAQPTNNKTKSDDILLDWLLENGTLVDGTDLVYEVTDKEGNIYRLCHSTNYVFELQAFYIQNHDDYQIVTRLPIEGSDKPKQKVDFYCEVSNSEGKERGIKCCHSPYHFTRKTPIEKGDVIGDSIYLPDYDDAERKAIVKIYDAMLDTADNLAHENLCKILDWLNDTICPLADCTLSDLGYYEYK